MAARSRLVLVLALGLSSSCAPAPSAEADGCAPCRCDACACGDGGAGDADLPAEDGSADADAEAGPGPARLRLMTFNIRHGAESSLEAVAEAIRAEEPTLVGLQEVDVDAARSGGVDQAHRLGQLTGMTTLFRTAVELSGGGLYGLALLSRWPVVSSERVLLTSRGEQRILVVVDVLAPSGELVPVAVCHLGLDSAERLAQAREVADELRGREWAVLMGDLNAEPPAAELAPLLEVLADAWPAAGAGEGFTFPSDLPSRRIDAILLGPGWPEPVEAHVPATEASDHRPVVVTLAEPAP